MRKAADLSVLFLTSACHGTHHFRATNAGGCISSMTPPEMFGVADRRGIGN